MKSSFDIASEKRKQDFLIYQRTKPENHRVVKDLIVEFDWNHSLIKIIKENMESYENVKNAFRKYLAEREAYLSKITENL